MIDLNEIAKNLVEIDAAKTEELTRSAIETNIPAKDIMDKGLIAGVQVVGDRFEKGEIFPRASYCWRSSEGSVKAAETFVD